MPRARRSPLFHAIVITGASLAGACGKEAVTTPLDASGATADEGGAEDAATATDASATMNDASATATDASCPDGSERSVPPCFLIK